MSTTAEIPCLAEVRTEKLADAIGEVCGKAVGVVLVGQTRRTRPRRTPLVFFRETTIGTPTIPERYRVGIAYALVLAPEPGDYPMPTGVSEVLTGKTARQLGTVILKKVQALHDTAEQRIALLEPGRGDVEVLFLDGKRFRLPTDRKHLWNRVAVSPDRRFLLVPRSEGDALDTIPWDAIRKPQSHLDEEERTKRLISQTLRRLREQAGLSQEKAAEKSGVSRKTINRLENAGNYPGTATLKALARAYGTTLAELLSDLRAET